MLGYEVPFFFGRDCFGERSLSPSKATFSQESCLNKICDNLSLIRYCLQTIRNGLFLSGSGERMCILCWNCYESLISDV